MVGTSRGILENITKYRKNRIFFDIFDIYRAYGHTLLKYKIYYHTVVCVCVLCILAETCCL